VQKVFDDALADHVAEAAAAARGEEYDDGYGMCVCSITYEDEEEAVTAVIGVTAHGGDDENGGEGQKGEKDADCAAQRQLETRVVKYLKNEGLSPFSAKVAFGFLQGQLHKDGGFDRMNRVNRYLQVLS